MRARSAAALFAGLAGALGIWAAAVGGAAEPGPADSAPAPGLVLPPEAPTRVRAVAGDAEATVRWTAPFDGGSPITHSMVAASPAGPAVEASGQATTARVTGLANGTAYTFIVTAANVVGASPPSAPSDPVTPAPAPPAETRALGEDAPGLAPDADTAGLAPAAFEGLRPITDSAATAPAGGRAPTGPETGSSAPRAPAAAGTAAAAAAAGGVVARPPGAPALVHGAPGDAEATVSWLPAPAGQSQVLGYVVRAAPGGQTVTVAGRATTAVVSGLTNGVAYTFTVQALTTAGPGPVSAPSAPVVPQGGP